MHTGAAKGEESTERGERLLKAKDLSSRSNVSMTLWGGPEQFVTSTDGKLTELSWAFR
jgi:hypothetical protein